MKNVYEIIIRTENGQTKATVYQNSLSVGSYYTYPNVEEDPASLEDFLATVATMVMAKECAAEDLREYWSK